MVSQQGAVSALDKPVPGLTLLPLRLFLGLTFIYAGIQKIGDRGFLRPGSHTYIGTQLLAFSRGSPIKPALLHLAEHASAIGMLTILTEMAIGGLILVGLFTRPAAFIGLILNLVFFLSASWHTYPFFYGSDIVFVACWLTLVLAGPGALALDDVVAPRLGRFLSEELGAARAAVLRRLIVGPEGHSADEIPSGMRLLTRGEVLVGMAVSAGLVVLGLVPRSSSSGGSSTLAAPVGSATSPPSTSRGSSPAPTASPGSSPPAASGKGGAIPAGAHKIGNISQLPANSAGVVQDPQSGDPAIIVRLPDSHVYAYDAVCTHAGCTVQYDPSQKLLLCPCHGGTFDPAHGAAVVAGPPPTPLSPIKMAIDAQGNIYIV